MDMLKKIWPNAFGFAPHNVGGLLAAIVVYIVIGVVIGLVCWIVGWAPLIGKIISWALRTIVGLYTAVGLVLSALHYAGILID